MLETLDRFGSSLWYWLALAMLGLTLEAAALYYQYALDYGPCVLCIHVRLWVLGFIVVGMLGAATRSIRALRVVLHLLTVIVTIGFLERSWQTLAVERRWLEGECSMDLGLPAWLAVERWLPSVFEAWEPCGYTPYIVLKITMAETLLGIGALVLVVALALTTAGLAGGRQRVSCADGTAAPPHALHAGARARRSPGLTSR